jgi:fructose-bisphosphate aldolase class II
MKMLREALDKAEHDRVAIGHFNVSDLVALKAITEASQEVGVPVLVGVSEGEREFMGVRQIAALVASLRDSGQAIFLNADHTHSIEKAEEAARAGFDEVLFDGSALAFEENAVETKRAVEAVRSVRDEIVVEGEIGWIGASSEIHAKAPEGLEKGLTTPEEAREFVNATGVDVLAPAVGNMHGLLQSMVRGESEKRLDVPRIRAIKEAARVFMTLHGGSGTNPKDLVEAIAAGMTIVHINTEVRLAWRRGLEESLAQDPNEVAPYKILPASLRAMKEVVRARLRLFAGEGAQPAPM